MRRWFVHVPCPRTECEGRVLVTGKDDYDLDYGHCSDCGTHQWTNADKDALCALTDGREEWPDPREYDGPDTLKELP